MPVSGGKAAGVEANADRTTAIPAAATAMVITVSLLALESLTVVYSYVGLWLSLGFWSGVAFDSVVCDPAQLVLLANENGSHYPPHALSAVLG